MKVLEQNKNKIINDYLNGKSKNKLSKEYCVNEWSIKNFLLKNNIKIRSQKDMRIKFNENFFFSQNMETYYFWGFMLGDGSLIKKSTGYKYLTVTVCEKDNSILNNFCKWLCLDNSNIKTGINNCGTKWNRLNLFGNISNLDFSKFGIVPNKTYDPISPKIDFNFIKPFLIGLIDADGCVVWKRLTKQGYFEQYITLVGHPIIMDWVIEQFRAIGYGGKINSQLVKGKWKRIRIQKKNDILELAKKLDITSYYEIILKRKWELLYNELIYQQQ